MAEAHFGQEIFQFLAELRVNNNREWFLSNKSRYEQHVKAPLLEFIAEFANSLDPRASACTARDFYCWLRCS